MPRLTEEQLLERDRAKVKAREDKIADRRLWAHVQGAES